MLNIVKRLFRSTPPLPPSVPDGVRVYAISDIHGRADLLQKAMQWIVQDAEKHPKAEVYELYLGDYVDRGMHSKQVLELMCQAPQANHTRICLKGNHEATLLDFLEDAAVMRSWMSYGGLPTLASYGIDLELDMTTDTFESMRKALLDAMPETHIAFLKQLKTDYTLGDYYFVHAGVHPKVPLDEQEERDQLWIRDAFLNHQKPFEKYIVHGHTPLPSPQFYPNRVNLDANESVEDLLPCLILQGIDKQIELIIAD